MIAPNIHNTQIRRRRKQAEEQVRQAAQQAQITLNGVLWQIINEHAEPVDDDIESTPVLTVSLSELKNVPANFALKVEANPEDETISIFATLVKPKGNIVLPDGSKLNG